MAIAAMAPALALVAAGCSSGGADSGASGDNAIEAPASAFPDDPATGSVVKIGLINPEGGPAISLPSSREAAEATVEYANTNLGGLAGHKIELVECANREDPSSARDCANQMVEAGVAAVVVTTTGQGDSMAPIITGAGIPYISPSGQSPAELSADPGFMLAAGLPGVLGSMATYAAEQGYSKVAAYATDNAAVIPAVKALAEPAFQAAGVDLEVVPVPLGTPDASPQVGSGLSDNPDAVAVIGDATMCTSTLKALKILGNTADKMIIQPCLDPATVDAVGDVVDGSTVFTTADTDSDDEEAVLYRSVLAKYAPGTETGGYTYTGYQGMLGLIRATENLQGEPTAANVAETMKNATDVPLPAGHGLTFTCDGQAMPQLPAVCGTKSIIGTADGDKLTDVRLLD